MTAKGSTRRSICASVEDSSRTCCGPPRTSLLSSWRGEFGTWKPIDAFGTGFRSLRSLRPAADAASGPAADLSKALDRQKSVQFSVVNGVQFSIAIDRAKKPWRSAWSVIASGRVDSLKSSRWVMLVFWLHPGPALQGVATSLLRRAEETSKPHGSFRGAFSHCRCVWPNQVRQHHKGGPLVRIISWNTNRRRKAEAQIDFLLSRKPDVVALQEVTPTTLPLIRKALASSSLQYLRTTVTGRTPRSGSHSYGVLIASAFPIIENAGILLRSIWKEKALSVLVETPRGPVEVHTVHIPPGSSHGWVKVCVLEAVYSGLTKESAQQPRILCGDFNCPQAELSSGEVVTWAQRLLPSGEIRPKRRVRGRPADRWDRAERNIVEGLRKFGFRDAYRSLHGYSTKGESWWTWNHIGRRFDHIYVSKDLKILCCDYLAEAHSWGLSDHSPIEASVR